MMYILNLIYLENTPVDTNQVVKSCIAGPLSDVSYIETSFCLMVSEVSVRVRLMSAFDKL